MPNNFNTAAADNHYADAELPEGGEPKPAEARPDESEGETALLPKSICPDMKPGDELVLKITRVHDDQYEVTYSPQPREEETPPEEAPAAAAGGGGGGGDMAAMME